MVGDETMRKPISGISSMAARSVLDELAQEVGLFREEHQGEGDRENEERPLQRLHGLLAVRDDLIGVPP